MLWVLGVLGVLSTGHQRLGLPILQGQPQGWGRVTIRGGAEVLGALGGRGGVRKRGSGGLRVLGIPEVPGVTAELGVCPSMPVASSGTGVHVAL